MVLFCSTGTDFSFGFNVLVAAFSNVWIDNATYKSIACFLLLTEKWCNYVFRTCLLCTENL